MNDKDYFDHPYCSNSTLNALGAELGLLPEIKGDKRNAYRLGSLFDAVVTEPAKLDLLRMRIFGTDYEFDKKELATARLMKKKLEENPTYKTFLAARPDFQKEVYVENFRFDGFELSMRAKLDYFAAGLVADLKSTAAASQKAFDSSVELFGYHRQMWLYCNLTGSSRALLFGVRKTKPHKVFVSKVQKGGALWEKAKKEIGRLAFKYYMTR